MATFNTKRFDEIQTKVLRVLRNELKQNEEEINDNTYPFAIAAVLRSLLQLRNYNRTTVEGVEAILYADDEDFK
jgi:hypothetical protein